MPAVWDRPPMGAAEKKWASPMVAVVARRRATGSVLRISIVDSNLRIRAERRHEEKVERRDYRHSEIRHGSFSSVLPLPAKAKESDIHAKYKDGILEVRAPIDESTPKASEIPISRT